MRRCEAKTKGQRIDSIRIKDPKCDSALWIFFMPGEGGNLKQKEGDENERNPRGEESELFRHFQRASAGQGVVAEGEGAAVPDPESAGELAVQRERAGGHYKGGEDRNHVRPAGAGAGGISDPASAARDAGKDGTQRICDPGAAESTAVRKSDRGESDCGMSDRGISDCRESDVGKSNTNE